MRAPTPSAAAERAVPDSAQPRTALRITDRQMASAARSVLAGGASRVEAQLRRMQYAAPDPTELAGNVRSLMRDIQSGLERRTVGRPCALRERSGADRRAKPGWPRSLAVFAIVQKEGSRKKPVVKQRARSKPGDRLSVSVADGALGRR
ncbi:MAG: hypothetical protein IPF51_06125 [Dehalococcoidia bacterium]|nr:hypothetical protein [Dehalococcoidia bacterium]